MHSDITKFAEEFNSSYTESANINFLWSTFTDKCSKIMNEHVPSKMSSEKLSQPWINKEVKQMARKKKRSYQKAKMSGKVRDWNKFKKTKNMHN